MTAPLVDGVAAVLVPGDLVVLVATIAGVGSAVGAVAEPTLPADAFAPNPGALVRGCGLFAPAPANVPVVLPLPPNVAE